MAHRLVYSDDARADLHAIYDWIAAGADPPTAFAYTSRIEAACERLTLFPSRGTPHDELMQGLRTVSFERNATIAYQVEGETVRMVGVFHRGRDLGAAFGEE